MATLSAGDLVDLRTRQARSSIYLSVFQPATLLTATVNNPAIIRGGRTLVYDNGTGSGFATIEAGQLIEIDTADGTKWTTIKSITGSQSAGTITLREHAIEINDNQVIRIKHFYPLVGIPATIRSGVFYKDFDVAYSTQNSTPNPVAIIGSHRVGTLSAGTIAFALNSSSSYAIASGASISSRVWSCVHNGGGVGGVSFDSTTGATPTLTITQADSYWLKCTVTDSNGRAQSSFRAIFVYERGVTDPYKDFTISGLSGDWQTGGYRFNVQVTGDVQLADFPDRTLALLWYENTFDGVPGFVDLWGTDAPNVICAGYLRRDQDNDNLDKGVGSVSFEVTTPDGVLDAISLLGSISINAVASPTVWYQYASWMTVGRAVHHLLKWHSTVLETCDVYGLMTNTLGVKNADFTESSILQMVNGLGYQRGIFSKLASDRRGRLHFAADSQMLNDAGRAALDTVFTLIAADISGVVDVVRQEEEQAAAVDLDGFSFDGTTGTPFISIAPGYRESSISFNMPEVRGSGGDSRKNQVLIDQTDSNEKSGRVLAAANNNPFEIRNNTPYNGVGAFDIVPTIGFYEWGLADVDLKRNTELNGRNLICRHVDHAINHTAGTIQTSVVFEPEALGPDGIAGNYPKSYPVPRMRSPSTSCDLAAGDLYDFSAGVSPNVCALSATKAIAISSGGEAYVLDISGTTVTPGVAAVYDALADDEPAVFALSATQAIVAYRRSSTNFARAVILDISGSTITPGTSVDIDASAVCVQFGIVALSATKAIVTYRQSTANEGRAVILDVSGSTITPGTAVAFHSADLAAGRTEVIALSATKALVAFRDEALSRAQACVLDVAVSTITPGAVQEVATSTITGGGIGLIALSSTLGYIAYRVNAGAIVGRTLTISGTTITVNTATDVTASGDTGVTAAMWSDNKIIHFTADSSPTDSYARTAGISGTAVVQNNDELTISGLNTTVFDMAQLTTRKAIVVDRSGSNSEAFILSCN